MKLAKLPGLSAQEHKVNKGDMDSRGGKEHRDAFNVVSPYIGWVFGHRNKGLDIDGEDMWHVLRQAEGGGWGLGPWGGEDTDRKRERECVF